MGKVVVQCYTTNAMYGGRPCASECDGMWHASHACAGGGVPARQLRANKRCEGTRTGCQGEQEVSGCIALQLVVMCLLWQSCAYAHSIQCCMQAGARMHHAVTASRQCCWGTCVQRKQQRMPYQCSSIVIDWTGDAGLLLCRCLLCIGHLQSHCLIRRCTECVCWREPAIAR